MHKKAQSISINTIIIAAIALAVLVVLFMIFTGRFKIFSEGVGETSTYSSCSDACKLGGYSSGAISDNCAAGTYKMYGKFKNVDLASQACCCS